MIARNMKYLVGLFAGLVTALIASPAFAQAVENASAFNDRDKWIAITGGFGVAIAAFGGALGQGKTASTALDGISRNPGAAKDMFVPMIIGLALIETLVIYSLVAFFVLQGKIH